nr:gibberellin 2-beta-dioxygenase 1-like [Ipomoea batatas]GME00714.1 gibberellin 2-beta-dioxygenase 1-like [Ipomoea batatas]
MDKTFLSGPSPFWHIHFHSLTILSPLAEATKPANGETAKVEFQRQKKCIHSAVAINRICRKYLTCMLDPTAKDQIVKACHEFGFFKVVNHGVPLEAVTKLEEEAVKFFNLPQLEKEKVGSPNPFGYGHKKIGTTGDVGWVEYLLLSTHNSITIPGNSQLFR